MASSETGASAAEQGGAQSAPAIPAAQRGGFGAIAVTCRSGPSNVISLFGPEQRRYEPWEPDLPEVPAMAAAPAGDAL